jgi:threonine dehydrogenase-like Zn-dependent dehydrogenase
LCVESAPLPTLEAGGSSSGEAIDPSFVDPSRSPRRGPELYKTFRDEKEGCIKVVLKP